MADVILKDRNGNDLPTFEGVAGIDALDANGNVQIFTPGEAEEKTVELDFSEGDMTVLPSSGKVMTSVGILKPKNLKPENIAEGIDIAGVLGIFAASGGGGVKAAYGEVKPTDKNGVVITHNLGIVPDLVIAVPNIGNSSYLSSAYGKSAALLAADGQITQYMGVKGVGYASVGGAEGIEGYTDRPIHSANTTTFTLGAPGWPINTVATYRWIAVGGLV